MKINKKNIIIPALMLTAGVSLVGSISGTLAWYQYSTRTQAAYIGTSVKATENLQIKVNSGAWKEELTSTDVSGALAENVGTELAPITTGALAKDADFPTTLYSNPVYQYTAYTQWAAATTKNYVEFSLFFRVLDIDGQTTASYLDKNLYLTDLTINDVTTGVDLSDAIRVHMSTSTTKALFAKTAESTDVNGKLDLNNDGEYDKKAHYEWEEAGEDLVYGEGTQTSYKANDTTMVADDSSAVLTGGKSFGKTGTTADGLEMKVRIWIEGWQKLSTGETGNKEESNSAVWNAAEYIGRKFQVGMRFAVQPVGTTEA